MARIVTLNKDGEQIAPKTFTTAVKDLKGNTLDALLSLLQSKEDVGLTTTSKKLVEAINELKIDIANAQHSGTTTPIDMSGYMRTDMVNVNLEKLHDKGGDAKLAFNDLSNVSPIVLDNIIRHLPPIVKLINDDTHPATKGLTAEEVLKLFYTNFHEETIPVTDWNTINGTTVFLQIQITQQGQELVQPLPSYTTNKLILVNVVYSGGVTSGTVKFTSTEKINGSAQEIVITKQGFSGLFIPLQNAQGWEFVNQEKTSLYTLGMQDDKGNVVIGVNDIEIDGATIEHDDTNNHTKVLIDGIEALDGVLNRDFKIKKIQSLDKSVRISNIGNGVADFAIYKDTDSQGVAMVVEYTQVHNMSYEYSQPSLSNILYEGGDRCYRNKSTNGIVIQDISGGDPNTDGGTHFLVQMNYVTNKSEDNTIVNNGSIRLALHDSDGNTLTDINGKLMEIGKDYKSGDTIQDMYYAGVIDGVTYKEVFYKLIGNLDGEEAISVGLGTGISVQAIDSSSGIGKAQAAFELNTGVNTIIGKKEYSYNDINFARILIKDSIESVGGDYTTNLGNNLYFDARTSIETQIINQGFHIKSTQSVLPTFSIIKKYSSIDLTRLQGRKIDISTTITNKDSALVVSMIGHKGVISNSIPRVESYSNGQAVFTNDWEEIDKMSISEDAVRERYKVTKTFTIPSDADYNELAFVLRLQDNSNPIDINIFDFEGDIKPNLTWVIVKEHWTKGQYGLLEKETFARSLVTCPTQFSAYRYTINSANTKIPFGVIKGGENFIKNNHSWKDSGAVDPYGVEGDGEAIETFTAKYSYSIHAHNERGSASDINIWMAKVNKDGTFTEIPGSRFTGSISANSSNIITQPEFSFKLSKGESVRMFGSSNIDDGWFIQANNGDHIPMVEIIIDAISLVEIPQDILVDNDLLQIQLFDGNSKVDSSLYDIKLDVSTGKITVSRK